MSSPTLAAREDEVENYLFVNCLVTFFFVLVALILLIRFCKLYNNHLRHLFAIGPGRDRQTYWMRNQSDWWPWIKKYFLYAPFWSKRHNHEFRINSAVSVGTLPSRLHSTILIAYLGMNLAYTFILDYRQTKPAIFAEWRGRTGALAVINLIPTILFALRNNPFIWLLQVSYDTFNLLHRWCARMVILQVIMHALAWALNKYETKHGGMQAIRLGLHRPMMQAGLGGFCIYCFILLQSPGPLRHAFYEVFLNVHRLAVYASFVMVYLHCKRGDLPQLPWVQLSIAMLGAEYAIRVLTLVWHNFSSKRGITRATVEALPGEACRVTFSLSRPWTFKPGSTVHVYFPRYSLWSSHPFSVAWSTDSIRNALGDAEKLPADGFAQSKCTNHDLDLEAHRGNAVTTEMSLIVRARTGFTRTLYEAALKAPQRTLTTRGMIEGPYGSHESLDSYGTVVLFAAGVGITHQLSYLRHLVASANPDSPTVAAKKVVLVWSMPTTECLEWVRPWMDEIMKMPGRRDVLQCLLFVTKPRSRQEVMVSPSGSVNLVPGRCEIQTILDKIIMERIGAMMVLTCGPGSFSDQVRNAVRRRTCRGINIEFVEEAFTY